ncbi:hypothetical protein BWQ96_03082 [Gracilariopsis chorda]|uniref:DUF1995 domain-containing protein n=1 Tax=Gracilariopsis chorda TaxID=448386 RepID=A0A2V3J183_9FLOR|nr:hypothetical protein BWQ96_03082 [Gracilariopsis chorda]|eukprot:PXF47140.1 hypothetical protein BWQ96_03082 [Gracilariopsis chorda]
MVELDPSSGDETYTLLKRSVPIARQIAESAESDVGEGVLVLLPDAGTAALARRDWRSECTLRVGALDDAVQLHDVKLVMVVAPSASEVGALVRVAQRAVEDGTPLMMLNADLVDMGVTGLSLNARRLRAQLIDSFENAFMLRMVRGGVLLRQWPGDWSVWGESGDDGYRFVSSFESIPDADALDGALFAGGDGSEGVLSKLQRFLRTYMKG